MATRNVNLTDTLDRFVEERVASGDYQNVSEVMRAGLRLLKTRTEADAARIAQFRVAVQAGLDQIERGEGIEVDDVSAWLDGIEAEVEAEFECGGSSSRLSPAWISRRSCGESRRAFGLKREPAIGA